MTAPISSLLAQCRRAELDIRLQGGSLTWKRGAAPEALLAEIEGRKPELEAYLDAAEAVGAMGAPRRSTHDQPLVASLNQESWFELVRTKPKASFHRVPAVAYLTNFEDSRFLSAAKRWVEAYPILRSSFRKENDEVLISLISPQEAEKVISQSIETAKLFEIDADNALVDAAIEYTKVSLDKPLFDFKIIKFKNTTAICLILHHIISDARSGDLYRDSLIQFYESEDLVAAAEGLTYGDYATWQREAFTPAVRSKLKAHWANWALAAQPLAHPSSGDHLTQFPGPSCAYTMILQANPLDDFKAAATHLRSSPYIVCLAGALNALARWAGQTNLGCLSVGDLRAYPSLRNTVGLFTCLDPLRVDFSDEPSPAQLVARLTDERMVAMRLRLPPLRGDWPASQARLLNLLPLQANSFSLPSLGSTAGLTGFSFRKTREIYKAESFSPVSLIFCNASNGIRIEIQYNSSCFSDEDQKSINDGFLSFLEICTSEANNRV